MSTPTPTPLPPLPPLPVHIEPSGPFAGIATLTLTQPPSPMVVLDADLIRAIEVAIKALPKTLTGFVLASASPRVFIAGADLKTIQSPSTPGSEGWDDDRLDKYLAFGQRIFGMIAELNCPTVAAINGAALGGGLELAMHCDALIAAPPSPSATGKPYPIGLPEAGLSICPGWGGTNLFPARIDPAEAIRRTCEGRPMNFDEAKSAGLFDVVAESPETLLATAKQWIIDNKPVAAARKQGSDAGAPLKWIGRSGVNGCKARVLAALADVKGEMLGKSASAAACIAAIEAGLEHGWQVALNVERAELVRLRHTEAGKAAIAGFFAKSKK